MKPTTSRMAMSVAGLAVVTALFAGCSGKVEVGRVTSQSGTSTTTTELAVTVDKDQLAAKAKEKLEQAAGQESKGWNATETSKEPSVPPNAAC
jgi:enterochelin esterase-like enzyme